MDAKLAIIDKRRPAPNVAQILNVIGEVRDQNVIIIDDMVDTAGTLVLSVDALAGKGPGGSSRPARTRSFPGAAIEKIEKSALERLYVTNTIPLTEKAKACSKIQVLSVAELFGEAIRRINEGSSVSSLFV